MTLSKQLATRLAEDVAARLPDMPELQAEILADTASALADIAADLRDPCEYTHAHTRHWCGHPTCRES